MTQKLIDLSGNGGGYAAATILVDITGAPVTVGAGGSTTVTTISDLLFTDDSGTQFIYRDNGATPPVFTTYKLDGTAYVVSTNPAPYSVKNVAITATALPLPTGAASAASQATANTSLASIATNTAGVSTAAGQATGNGSLATIATNTTGAATAAAQGTGNTSLATIATNTTGASTATLQTTGNSSLATIATNSGTASTTALQTAGNTSLSSIATNTTNSATAAAQATGNTSLATIVTNTTGVATAANQNTTNTSLSTIATNTTGSSTAANQVTTNASLATIASKAGASAISDGVTPSIKATVAAFHNSDNQQLGGTSYGLNTGGVAQLLNPTGGIDRQRETGFDNVSAAGVASGTQQLAAPILGITTAQAVTPSATAQSVTLSSLSSLARGTTLSVQVGSTINIDTGNSAEQVFISAVNTAAKMVTGIFTKAHTTGVAISTFAYNQARDSTILDGSPPSGLPAGATYLFNGALNAGAGGMEIERSAAGELDGASGAGTNIAAEYEYNSGGPMTTGTVPSGLQFDRARNLQGKGSATTTINGAVAAGVTSLVLTAVVGLQAGQQIRLDRNTVNECSAYVSASYIPGTLTVALQSATFFAHASGSTVDWDVFASAGPGLNGFTATGLGIEEEVLYNPVDGKYYIERSASQDAMPAANIVAESGVLWNGATFDRMRSAVSDALPTTGIAAEAAMVWNGTTFDRMPGSAALGVTVNQKGVVLTQTTLSVTATSQTLIAANPSRRYLSWMVVGTADVTISPASPVVAGLGLIYQASGVGKQGASEEFPSSAPTNAFYAIAAATGSTIIVWEGV